MEQQWDSGDHFGAGGEVRGEDENDPEYLCDLLRCMAEMGASLRLQADPAALYKQLVAIFCRALRFRAALLYLNDGSDSFHLASGCGLAPAEMDLRQQQPLAECVLAHLLVDYCRVGDVYFLPAEAAIWQDQTYVGSVDILRLPAEAPPADLEARAWRARDMLLIPLVGEEDRQFGFLLPGCPLNGLRPTRRTMDLCGLFAKQVAAIMEGVRLSNELREAARQAREAERLKDDFLLAASHELRTPLTAVQGYLELLGEYGDALDEVSRARFIQNARCGCNELVLLLGSVFDILPI